ncbi:Uncharacterised protein [Mycobacterium tuberculosis]|nr:Uncharacterised protein [Mycobacterium tuberculosis]CNW78351.1 Uncharacterised protein [Mycobacterium tuberculosis]COX30568.1 Uncharacterised protein [Mycobacterium tuberculosis]
MHDRRLQAGKQRGGPVGVNGVVVAGHHRERAHVDRRGDRDVAAATARGVGGVRRHRATGSRRVGELGGTGATQDRESLLESGDHGAIGAGNDDRDRHDAAHVRIGCVGSRCGDGQLGRDRGQLTDHAGGVVQMHQAQQAFHHRLTGVGDRRSDGRENRWPTRADERVGHVGEAGCQRLTERGGDAGVVGNTLGVPVHRQSGRPVGHRRQELRAVDTGGDRQHRAHGAGGVLGGDHRGAAIDGVGRQRESDVDPGARDGHAQGDVVAVRLQPGAGG